MLKKQNWMKGVRRTKFCLKLQIEYLNKCVFAHEELYIIKVPKKFYMDKSHLLCTLMVVSWLEVDKYHFRPPEKMKNFLVWK